MKTFLKAMIVFLFIPLLAYAIYRGYDQTWTGLQGYTNNKGELIHPKKLWDWLQLVIVPLFLAGGVWVLNKVQKKSEQQIETDRQRQKALEDYYDCMTDLLLKEKLRESDKNSEPRSIARTRTLAVLSILDGSRKSQAIQFLYESGLIKKDPIIPLTGADLTYAELNHATLRGSELRGVYFNNAHFREANLIESDLRGSDFSYADLTGADLKKVKLTQAILRKTKLCKVDLREAVVEREELSCAYLNGSYLPRKNRKGDDNG